MSSDLRNQLETTLGTAYTLERELGGGGMSRVFVAEETSLHRQVVVKVLSPELSAGINVDRFKREIQLAAKLQHPHIVPVLTTGETSGLPYYTMPFVAGESLRVRIARGPLPISEAVGILRDVARALAFAHKQGVVHRDIKPENVLLTEGSATVTDFGIAKAVSASKTDAPGATLTQIGTSLGTPAYMAPEQVAGDPNTDHRADLYAFGAVAYELLAGHPPFVAPTPQRLLAAHLGETPRPILELRPDMPAALAELVMKCLEKDAAARPESAAAMLLALDTSTSTSEAAPMPSILMGGPGMWKKALAIYAGAFVAVAVLARAAIVGIGLPDWVFPGALIVMALGLPVILATAYVHRVTHRALVATPTLTPGGSAAPKGTMATMALKAAPHVSWRRTAMGGVYALGTFIALIGVWILLRALGIGPAASLIGKGAFGAKETLVVADFRGPAGDSALGGTVAEALRTDLGQSTSLNVMTRATVREVLRLMQRPLDASVNFDLAREIATREGAKAVLDGEITKLGQSYVVAARLVSSIDGTELARFRETADDENALVGTLGALSRDVRGKIGESLKDIRETKPLERVSTTSLAALRKYVEGNRLIDEAVDFERGIPLLREAVALDSGFAMAWRKIAVGLNNQGGDRAGMMQAAATAYRHRERLSDTERLLTEAYYWSNGPTPNRDRTIAAYEALIEADSNNGTALNNVSVDYSIRRDFERAERALRRAVRVVRPTANAFNNLVNAQVRLGRLSAAESTAATFAARIPASSNLWNPAWTTAWARGDLARADSVARSAYSEARAPQNVTAGAGRLAATAYLRGKAREGLRWDMEENGSVYRRTQAPDRLLLMAIDSARYVAHFLDDRPRAGAIIRRALERTPMSQVPVAQRPWNPLIQLAATMRDPALARETAAGFDRDLPDIGSINPEGDRARFRAFAAVAAGRNEEALTNFREADRLFAINDRRAMVEMANAFDLAGTPDSAAVYFERFLVTRDPVPFNDDFYRAGTHKRLGELYEAKGDTAKAESNYTKFVELWKDADPELQPKVREVRGRLARLRRGKG